VANRACATSSKLDLINVENGIGNVHGGVFRPNQFVIASTIEGNAEFSTVKL